MFNVMKEKEVEEVSVKIKEASKDIDDNKKINQDKIAEYKSLNERISELEAELKKAKFDLDNANKASITSAIMIKKLEKFKEEQELLLKADEREKEILALYDRQKGFWETLESRMKLKQEELGGDLEGIAEPEAPSLVIKKMQNLIDAPRSFSEQAMMIRGAIGKYQMAIKEICEFNIDGRNITAEMKQRRLNILDAFLMSPRITGLWD